MLVTTRGTGRWRLHERVSLLSHGNRGYQGHDQHRQNLGAELTHLSHSMRNSPRVIQRETVKIKAGRDGGIGRRVGLRIQ
jgi:hypothetical protein